MHEAFCAQIPLLLEMMAEHNKYTHRQNKVLHNDYERKKFFEGEDCLRLRAFERC